MTDKPFAQVPDGRRAIEPVLWTDAEPERLARDRSEVAEFAPGLEYQAPNLHDEQGFPQGGWYGELPKWPFGRTQPEGLNELVNGAGLRVAVHYAAAHPMVPPTVYPVDPKPLLWEQTQTAWHVAPGGSLCLLQSDGAWQPEASITELLAKAAGWHIEYALMKVGVIERMTISGIASDPSIDHLIAEAVRSLAAASDPQRVVES